jgi:VanZ family protein
MPVIRLILLSGFWLPLLACTYLALAPSPPDTVFRISDVLLHALAFIYLTFALILAYADKGLWQTFAWMLAYGLLLELIQSFEPDRTAELKDVFVDVGGILVGIGLGRFAADTVRELIRNIAGRLGIV